MGPIQKAQYGVKAFSSLGPELLKKFLILYRFIPHI